MSDNNPYDPNNTYHYPPHNYYAQPKPGTISVETQNSKGSGFGKKATSITIAACLVSALFGGAVGGTVVAAGHTDGTGTNTSSTSSTPVTNTVSETTTTNLAATVKNSFSSVVTISAVSGQEAGTGSGVVINKDGYIVTNAHVATLEGATDQAKLTVQTSTGDTYTARLIGYDPTADVAVLKVDKNVKGIKPISFAPSSNLQVGSQTIAIGSPLGLSGTVTTGIISSLNRPIAVASSQVGQDKQSNPYAQQSTNTVALSAIQTDAAINAGNSGGALLDANGNLIGLNVAISSTSQNSGSIGIGYAIPSDYVKRITTDIIENGRGTHGSLGVSVTDDAEANSSFTTGATVQAVSSDSPAAAAGLQKGDVITKVDDTVISSATQLTAVIKQDAPSTKVTVSYERDGKPNTTEVTLKQLSN
jgi:putative serine protease PepD